MEKEEKRILGAQEILFYAMNEASPMHFLMAAEIEGPTDQMAWQKGVAMLQKVHPMLSMSIIAGGDDLVFEHTDVPLELQIAELTQEFDLSQAMKEELERGFRSDNGPLARIKLFYSTEKSVIAIAAHHSVSDALSSVNLINDLLGLLSGKIIQDFSLQPSVDEFLGFDNKGIASKINKQIKPGSPLPHAFTRQHPPVRVDVLHFSNELTTQLVESAKKQNTTVHGVLQAAVALSLKELSFENARPAYIMSPFSVRKELNIGTDFGLYIDTKVVAVGTNGGDDFWNIARAATAELANVHTPEFLKNSSEQLRGLVSYSDDLIQFIKDNFTFDVMLSNLGRLSFNNAGSALKVKSVTGPFIIPGFNHTQGIGAATYNGNLVLTNSSRYLVTGLLKAIEAKIHNAIK